MFTCNNFGHKVVYCREYGRNFEARHVYVAPYNIECYKFHNNGHIARDCRIMMKSSMKELMMKSSMRENIDIRYNKVWRRNKKQEEQVNEELLEIILTIFTELLNHDESTDKEEDVRIQNDDPIVE
jgi:hypothetical protein